jgi:hypothetical protein
MPAAILPHERLKRVSQARIKDTNLWKEGVSLETDAACSIQILLCVVATDRWRLARNFRLQAKKMMSPANSNFRSAISRFYYSMYHAMRASVFIDKEGDDHEEHSKLPLQVPMDFDPMGVDWQIKLKDARLLTRLSLFGTIWVQDRGNSVVLGERSTPQGWPGF